MDSAAEDGDVADCNEAGTSPQQDDSELDAPVREMVSADG